MPGKARKVAQIISSKEEALEVVGEKRGKLTRKNHDERWDQLT